MENNVKELIDKDFKDYATRGYHSTFLYGYIAGLVSMAEFADLITYEEGDYVRDAKYAICQAYTQEEMNSN